MEAFARCPRKPFFGLAAAGIAGIVVADWMHLSSPWLLAVTMALAVAAFVRPCRVTCWVLTAVVFALLHTARHQDHPARRFAAGLPENGQATELEGVVWSEPTVLSSGRGEAASFWTRLDRATAHPAISGSLCMLHWSGPAPSYGDRVSVKGIARRLNDVRNPGAFDSASWLTRQGVHFQVLTNERSACAVIGHREGQWFRQFAMDARVSIKARLDYGLPNDPEVATLISSMVLGMRGETPPELKELFQKTGTLHLFAVSGLNVGMLAIIAWYALKPFRVPRRRAALLIVPFLAAYAVIAGMSASCVRATVMAVFVLMAPLFERESVPVNSLAAAAFAILAWDTNEFFNPGFQLSFVLVAAILAMARPIQSVCEKPCMPDAFIPRRLWTRGQVGRVAIMRLVAGSIAVGAASWVGSLLFMAGYFHLVAPIALIANFIAVPIAFVMLSLGMFSLIAGTLVSGLAAIINHANWLCARGLIFTVEFFAGVPSGHVYVEWPGVSSSPVCDVVVLDAGEGGAIHVRTAKGDWMIDTGHRRDYNWMLLPYLRSRGVDRLNGLILTHGDAAHVGGGPMLMEDFSPKWVADSFAQDRSPSRREFHAALAASGVGRRFLCRGDLVELSPGARLEVIYPPGNWPRALADDKALVFRLNTPGGRVLFMADTGFAVEQWLLENERDIRADIVVKGWPDRDFSGTIDFLSAVDPAAVICAAPNFGAGQSFDEWAAQLRTRGVRVFPQEQCGAVRIQMRENGETSVASWRQPVP